ncbi:MAG TPA: hypothetical protein VFV50_00895, partial [Bdellovibrionales bacterium]|nr:hypothetical protein [Bdellovibrionales bacterium]
MIIRLLVFALLLAVPFGAEARSFTKKASRYPSPIGVIELLKAKFAGAEDPAGLETRLSDACRGVNGDNADSLGVNQTLTGQPVTEQPNHFFELWFLNCLKDYFNRLVYDSPVRENLLKEMIEGFDPSVLNWLDASTRIHPAIGLNGGYPKLATAAEFGSIPASAIAPST